MNHPRMTFNGRRWALLFGFLLAFSLPKHVERGTRYEGRVSCERYEVKPWGFSLLEDVFGRELGFAYSSGEDCR